MEEIARVKGVPGRGRKKGSSHGGHGGDGGHEGEKEKVVPHSFSFSSSLSCSVIADGSLRNGD